MRWRMNKKMERKRDAEMKLRRDAIDWMSNVEVSWRMKWRGDGGEIGQAGVDKTRWRVELVITTTQRWPKMELLCSNNVDWMRRRMELLCWNIADWTMRRRIDETPLAE